ncbi:hypothetical protein N7501_004087 [Penicillium viridicatum]|nr:hypothetical protein N7501_004087 [Penicillium viridicatum]
MSRALTTSPALVLPTNTSKLAREFSNDGRHVFARARVSIHLESGINKSKRTYEHGYVDRILLIRLLALLSLVGVAAGHFPCQI